MGSESLEGRTGDGDRRGASGILDNLETSLSTLGCANGSWIGAEDLDLGAASRLPSAAGVGKRRGGGGGGGGGDPRGDPRGEGDIEPIDRVSVTE